MNDSENLRRAILCVGTLFHSELIDYYYGLYRGELTQLQVRALDYIIETGGARQQDLAEKLDIPKQHAAKIAFHLLSMGIIDRKAAPGDRRAALLTASEKGIAYHGEHLEESFRHFFNLAENLSPEENAEMESALCAITRIEPQFTRKR